MAGLVLLRQRPGSARGITFVTLEDETGHINLVVRQAIWDRYHRAAQGAKAMLVDGHVERQGQVIHVVAGRLEDLSDYLPGLPNRSRDFR